MDVAVGRIDSDGRILNVQTGQFFNSALVPADVIGLSIREITDPCIHKYLLGTLRSALAFQKPRCCGYRICYNGYSGDRWVRIIPAGPHEVEFIQWVATVSNDFYLPDMRL